MLPVWLIGEPCVEKLEEGSGCAGVLAGMSAELSMLELQERAGQTAGLPEIVQFACTVAASFGVKKSEWFASWRMQASGTGVTVTPTEQEVEALQRALGCRQEASTLPFCGAGASEPTSRRFIFVDAPASVVEVIILPPETSVDQPSDGHCAGKPPEVQFTAIVRSPPGKR